MVFLWRTGQTSWTPRWSALVQKHNVSTEACGFSGCISLYATCASMQQCCWDCVCVLLCGFHQKARDFKAMKSSQAFVFYWCLTRLFVFMQASLRTSRWSTLEKAHLTSLNTASDFLHDSQFKDKCLQPLIY